MPREKTRNKEEKRGEEQRGKEKRRKRGEEEGRKEGRRWGRGGDGRAREKQKNEMPGYGVLFQGSLDST